MIIGIDNIVEFLRVNNCEKFQLRTAPDKDAYIFKPHADESFEQAIARLRDTLDLYSGDKFWLEGWEKEGQTKNWFRTWCRNDAHPSTQSINGMPVISGLTPDEVDRRIHEAVTKTQMEYRLKDLERENAELLAEYKEYEKDKNSLQTQLIERVTPYVGTILGNLFPKIAVAGPIPGQETVPAQDYDGHEIVTFGGDDEVDQERLGIVLERLFIVEPDLILLLEALADKAEQNPAQWQSYKPMIMGFLK